MTVLVIGVVAPLLGLNLRLQSRERSWPGPLSARVLPGRAARRGRWGSWSVTQIGGLLVFSPIDLTIGAR